MNIYEKLNKINDNESLSEKYNVKNVKELKKLKESKELVQLVAKVFSDRDPLDIVKEVISVGGENLRDALLNLFDRIELLCDDYYYFAISRDSVLEMEEELGREFTGDELIDKLENANDLSDLYITELKDLSTGKILVSAESLQEDTHKSTKDYAEVAKQIIADLESRGFVNSDIAAIGSMIK